MSQDIASQLSDTVRTAYATGTPLCIRGGGSKDFLGGTLQGTTMETGGHRGIIDYGPAELVVTVRAGTALHELEASLAQSRQMLGFEPPHFDHTATVGGTVACALAGPRRAFAGGVRDAMLGCRIIDGRGEIMHFGGEVMKNVAGYDVSRLMTGAMGTLGLLLDVSLRVVPQTETSLTLRQDCSQNDGITRMRALCRQPWPLTGLCHDGTALYVRLAGSEAGVRAAADHIGGDTLDQPLWDALREFRHPFFDTGATVWRLTLAPAASLPEWGEWLIDWGGNLRWLKAAHAADVHDYATRHGGQASVFRRAADDDTPPPVPTPALHALRQRLKTAFDPKGILNRGRLEAAF